MSIRILVVDDHGVLRAGMVALLNQELDMEPVGEAESANEAIRLANDLCPDVILMDISLPDMSGIEAVKTIKRLLPEINIIMLTVHEDISLLQESIRAGASGYVLKRAVKTELINAIQAALRGEMYIHPAMTRLLLVEPSDSSLENTPVEPLSPREQEVLGLIIQGYTNHQAAELLNISVRTVEYHRSNIMGKLNLSSRVELIRYAKERGLM